MPSFNVQGMTCGHCVKAVTQAVHSVDPQAKVAVDLASGKVEVESIAESTRLAAAIQEEGYSVSAV